MNRKFFNKDVDPACEYCSHGRKSFIKGEILCIKKGVMQSSGSCSHYSYDPLRRTPKPKPVLPQFDPEEFKL